MPYLLTNRICTKCKESNKLFRFRWHGQNQSHVFVSYCKDCEQKVTLKHQQENREYWRQKNKESYARWSEEQREKRNIQSLLRHKRIRHSKFTDELTELVSTEAYMLAKQREKLTGIKWHVDHIVPLNGKLVSGLHIWSNLAVIPASINLSKGNKEMVNRRS